LIAFIGEKKKQQYPEGRNNKEKEK